MHVLSQRIVEHYRKTPTNLTDPRISDLIINAACTPGASGPFASLARLLVEKDGLSHRRGGTPCNQGIISRHNGEEACKLVINQILGFHWKAFAHPLLLRELVSRVLIIANAALCLLTTIVLSVPRPALSSSRKTIREVWTLIFRASTLSGVKECLDFELSFLGSGGS